MINICYTFLKRYSRHQHLVHTTLRRYIPPMRNQLLPSQWELALEYAQVSVMQYLHNTSLYHLCKQLRLLRLPTPTLYQTCWGRRFPIRRHLTHTQSVVAVLMEAMLMTWLGHLDPGATTQYLQTLQLRRHLPTQFRAGLLKLAVSFLE